MPNHTLVDLEKMFSHYLTCEPPNSLLSRIRSTFLQDEPLNDIRSAIAFIQTHSDIQFRIQAINKISLLMEFAKQKQDTNLNSKIEKIKSLLVINNKQWKSKLLQADYITLHDIHKVKVNFNKTANQAIQFENRFTETYSTDIAIMTGSSFSTNKEYILKEESSNYHLVLDAAYIAKQGTQTLIALADGCGHFKEYPKNISTSRSAHFACKNAIRYMSLVNNADQLKQNLASFIPLLEDQLRSKASLLDFQGQTTLLAAKTFVAADAIRVVGINVGDSLLIAWQPQINQVQVLAPARVIKRDKFNQWSPLSIPGNYVYELAYPFDYTFRNSVVLIHMTDGLYEGLKCTYTEVKIGNYPCQQITVEAGILENLFKPLIEKRIYLESVNILLQYFLKQIEGKRQLYLQNASIAKEKLQELKQQKEVINQIEYPKLEALRATDGNTQAYLTAEIEFEQKCQALNQQLKEATYASEFSVGDDVSVAGIVLRPM